MHLIGRQRYKKVIFAALKKRTMTDIEKIDLTDFDYAGEGANGASYHHKTNPALMLKLALEGKSIQHLEKELAVAQKVYALGVPTPKPGHLVTDGCRYGILFHRILNKKSFSRIVGDDPTQVPNMAREFAEMCKQLHQTICPKDQFENVKTFYNKLLEENPFYTADEKAKVAKFINDTPDADTAIHGDLQFSNAITDGKQHYFIDLGDFVYGNPLFDLGMVLLTCCYEDTPFLEEVFHMNQDTAHKFWLAFVPAYFGPCADPDEIDRRIRPYAGLKSLIIERDCHQPFPQYRALMDEVLLNL